MDRAERRRKALRLMNRFVSRARLPRFGMSVITLLTFLAIFIASYVLLRSGVETMWLRYALAVLIGYAVFILLLLCWTHNEWGDFLFGDGDSSGSSCGETTGASPDPATPSPAPDHAAGSGDALSLWDFDIGDLGIVILVFAIIFAGFAFIFSLLYSSAPLLLAELMLDAGLAASLYRNLDAVPREYWLMTAIRRTWHMFALLAFIMVGLGFILGRHAPEAHTISEALRQVMFSDSAQN